jgi:hypothetical protein
VKIKVTVAEAEQFLLPKTGLLRLPQALYV